MIDLTLDRLKENYTALENWDDRFTYIISVGKKVPHMDEKLKTEDRRVQGCMSRVWINIQPIKNLTDPIVFDADSDAAIVRGLIGVLMSMCLEKNALDIVKMDVDDIFKDLELDQHLSPGRANGFHSMINTLKKGCLKTIMSQHAND